MKIRWLMIALFFKVSVMQAELEESNPYHWAEKWTVEEGHAPLFAVLATVDAESNPYTRTIAVSRD